MLYIYVLIHATGSLYAPRSFKQVASRCSPRVIKESKNRNAQGQIAHSVDLQEQLLRLDSVLANIDQSLMAQSRVPMQRPMQGH